MVSNEITAREGAGSVCRGCSGGGGGVNGPVRAELAQPVDNANKRLAKLD